MWKTKQEKDFLCFQLKICKLETQSVVLRRLRTWKICFYEEILLVTWFIISDYDANHELTFQLRNLFITIKNDSLENFMDRQSLSLSLPQLLFAFLVHSFSKHLIANNFHQGKQERRNHWIIHRFECGERKTTKQNEKRQNYHNHNYIDQFEEEKLCYMKYIWH